MNPSTALRTAAEQAAARHRARQVLNTPIEARPYTIFQENEGQVATHVPISFTCPICHCNIHGEHIALIQFEAGKGLVFYTSQGHRLYYKGLALIRVDCGQPVTATVSPAHSP